MTENWEDVLAVVWDDADYVVNKNKKKRIEIDIRPDEFSTPVEYSGKGKAIIREKNTDKVLGTLDFYLEYIDSEDRDDWREWFVIKKQNFTKANKLSKVI